MKLILLWYVVRKKHVRKKPRLNVLYKSCVGPNFEPNQSNKATNLMRSMDTFMCIDSLSSTEFDDKFSNIMQMMMKTSPIELNILDHVNVVNIACSQKVALFLTDDGTVYCSGFDEKRRGILGLDGRFEQVKPIANPSLISYKIQSISVWETHAWATDSETNLFTWGTGLNGELGQDKVFNLPIPTKVSLPDTTEIKEAKVAKGYTAFKTSGGYLFIMGDINLNKNQLPWRMRGQHFLRQVEKVTNYFIRSFWCNNEYIAVLTQTGEVIYIDEKLNISKLYSEICRNSRKNKEDRFEFLTLTKNNIIALSRKEMYIWTPEYNKPPFHPPASSKSSSRYDDTRESKSSERYTREKHIEQTSKFGFVVSFEYKLIL